MKYLSIACLAALLLTACGRDRTTLAPNENPAVAISKVDGPLSDIEVGAFVDVIDALRPRSGALVVAAAQQYDPVSGQITDNPISVYVTASDTLAVDSVELSLNGTSMGTYLRGSEGVFKNPFIFPAPRSGLVSVPIPGAVSGLVSSELRALASDTSGLLSEAVVLEVQADGSRPNIAYSVIGNGPPYLGPVTISAQASDPETGMRDFAVFLNGEEQPINPQTPYSLDIIVEPAPGVQTVRLIAENGVFVPNEVVFTFVVAEETEAPPITLPPTDPVPPTDPPTNPPPPTDPPTNPPPPTDPPTNPPPPTDPPTDPPPPTDPTPPTDPVNAPPSVSLSAVPTMGDAPLTVNFTATATDADGDTLTYTWDFGNGDTASSGTTQSVTYEVDGSYIVSVTVTDGNGGEAIASAQITVGDGGSGGAAPTVTSFTVNGKETVEVRSNTDVTLAWEISGAPTEVVISSSSGDERDVTDDDDQKITVSPSKTMTYTITATNSAGTTTETVEVVIDDNGGVDAVDDSVSTKRNESETINVLGNDKPGPRALIIVAATTPKEGGTVEISRDSKTIIYTPADDFVGTDTFTYTVSDRDGNRSRAKVTVKVNR